MSAVATDVRRSSPREHRVLFYALDEDLLTAVTEFVAEGLRNDEMVIAICTSQHEAGLDIRLTRRGIDPGDVRRAGRLVVLDAADTLAAFADGGPPAFDAVVGTVVRDAARHGRPVRAFGEMVAVLWADGHLAAAIELELLWCGLGERVEFELLCTYPTTQLLSPGTVAAVNDVCALHTSVHAAGSVGSRPASVRAYPARSESVTAARHDLAAALGTNDAPQAVDVARLIVTELAANAVLHARTEFVVEATRHDDILRIAVRDGDARPLHRRVPGLDGESGRGINLVGTLSRRWGIDFYATGKVVWAEIALT